MDWRAPIAGESYDWIGINCGVKVVGANSRSETAYPIL